MISPRVPQSFTHGIKHGKMLLGKVMNQVRRFGGQMPCSTPTVAPSNNPSGEYVFEVGISSLKRQLTPGYCLDELALKRISHNTSRLLL